LSKHFPDGRWPELLKTRNAKRASVFALRENVGASLVVSSLLLLFKWKANMPNLELNAVTTSAATKAIGAHGNHKPVLMRACNNRKRAC
jgi:hypothetical protein